MSQRIKFWLVALNLALLGVWAFSVLPQLLRDQAPAGLLQWRDALVVLSGIFTFAWMSAAMLLSLRLAWLESRLGGLDKLYHLHKWLGIGAGLLVFVHWMIELLPKSMVDAGWLQVPAQDDDGGGEEGFWTELADGLGEWMAYPMLALVVLALIKRFSYGHFRFTHKLMSLIFLLGIYHGLMLLPGHLWWQPAGWLVAVFAAVGGGAALYALAGRIGQRQRYPATIENWRQTAGGVLQIECHVATTWPGHRAGQFLLATFERQEGAHPFSIATDWRGGGATKSLMLTVKPLGDYTGQLADRLKPGQNIVLEGPYGAFTFDADHKAQTAATAAPQIWIAGGIGVAPFLARLDALANKGAGHGQDIHFFYSIPDASHCPAQLADLCQAAGVQLHCRHTQSEGLQPFSAIGEHLRADTSVWFCGPADWGRALGKALKAAGLPARRYHRELFEFR
ncbi:MAG: ferric reductase-like transmembrane domain-containing protein [Burkholderiaceae bacterium]|jgi:predicted ferric reductase|nr:ferric reductase-like transmembrane domain-containing protein [Burkholderiaceae bacterium]